MDILFLRHSLGIKDNPSRWQFELPVRIEMYLMMPPPFSDAKHSEWLDQFKLDLQEWSTDLFAVISTACERRGQEWSEHIKARSELQRARASLEMEKKQHEATRVQLQREREQHLLDKAQSKDKVPQAQLDKEREQLKREEPARSGAWPSDGGLRNAHSTPKRTCATRLYASTTSNRADTT